MYNLPYGGVSVKQRGISEKAITSVTSLSKNHAIEKKRCLKNVCMDSKKFQHKLMALKRIFKDTFTIADILVRTC